MDKFERFFKQTCRYGSPAFIVCHTYICSLLKSVSFTPSLIRTQTIYRGVFPIQFFALISALNLNRTLMELRSSASSDSNAKCRAVCLNLLVCSYIPEVSTRPLPQPPPKVYSSPLMGTCIL